MIVHALTSHGINTVIFDVADALEVPVLVAALLALAAALSELGRFAVEVWSRRGRRSGLEPAVASGDSALRGGDEVSARLTLAPLARSAPMGRALERVLASARAPGGEHRVAKALADFDFDAQRRLARTRLLVRIGPALGLMGTLIPLSPALTGLAQGNVARLSENLRVAFSVTVLGLLVGAVAFAISLYRDRLYGEDLSDLEYVAAVLSDPVPATGDPK